MNDKENRGMNKKKSIGKLTSKKGTMIHAAAKQSKPLHAKTPTGSFKTGTPFGYKNKAQSKN
jgi:hypothetical protein